jgi:hypothetical protein
MTKEMIDTIGSRMVTKARLVNRFLERWREGKEEGNLRAYPFYSEFQGMRQLLQAMGVVFDIEYDDDAIKMTAITIMGERFEV